ncbi:MAG: hypothetical protein VSS75_025175 [Candidatus Parabeggiatoa sp.]|nr:hypothetical protein [Candidatus Parabeggiatoa sp.]
MYKTEDVLNAARAIRSHLPELLSHEAQAVENELSTLLAQADAGEDVEIDIFDLLGGHEATRQWMEAALEDKQIYSGEKIYSPLPTPDPQVVNSNKRVSKLTIHVCPNDGACDCGQYPEGWMPSMIGDCIPNCPTHHQPLIPE